MIAALEEGQSPLLLTERRDHLEFFAEKLRAATRHLIVLHGGLSNRERKEALATLAAIPEYEERLVIATSRYVGEGFDDRVSTRSPLRFAWPGEARSCSTRAGSTESTPGAQRSAGLRAAAHS